MAMNYKYLDRGAEALIEASELPVEKGIAIAVRTTGYEIGEDEVVQLSIVDLSGKELFVQTVKPQNIEEWNNDAASGGISPADVEDAPELYQFEDEIHDLFDNASVVVGLHMPFMHEIIESSWVSLPDCNEFDLMAEFCASHSTTDYEGQPATVATLEGIASYYGVACGSADTTQMARAAAHCYTKLVEEHKDQRASKSPEYWAEHDRMVAEAEKNDAQKRAVDRARQKKQLLINAVLWLCAAAVFSNLAVQLHIRGFDFGFVAIAAAAAIFFAVRWVMMLYAVYKLGKNKQ